MKLALKVDVDTYRGTREGVPALVDVLKRFGAGATFLFSLGPDHTGRAITRALRPGFLKKVSRTSVVEHYGLKTLLYGTLLPGPHIGRTCANEMWAVRDAGFEVGVHAFDHVKWQDGVTRASPDWTRAEMRKAIEAYEHVFGSRPNTHGAAGWQMNDAAYSLEQQLGLRYASDGRGTHPFIPVVGGRPVDVPQLPTTLPTLDELIGTEDLTADNVHEHVLTLTTTALPTGHVYTLHAELEGMKLLPVFERLLAGWKEQGYKLVTMENLLADLDVARLPRHAVKTGRIKGRSGLLATQGPRVSEAA